MLQASTPVPPGALPEFGNSLVPSFRRPWSAPIHSGDARAGAAAVVGFVPGMLPGLVPQDQPVTTGIPGPEAAMHATSMAGETCP